MLGYNIHQFMATRDNDKLRQENTELKTQIAALQEETKELKEEVEFMNKIFEHGKSMVGHMYHKTKQGIKVWVDVINITKKELIELDRDEDVIQWLQDIDIKFKDRDW